MQRLILRRLQNGLRFHSLNISDMGSITINSIQKTYDSSISGDERLITIEKDGSLTTVKIDLIMNNSDGNTNLKWVDIQ